MAKSKLSILWMGAGDFNGELKYDGAVVGIVTGGKLYLDKSLTTQAMLELLDTKCPNRWPVEHVRHEQMKRVRTAMMIGSLCNME